MKRFLLTYVVGCFVPFSSMGQGLINTDYRTITMHSDGSLGTQQEAAISYLNSGTSTPVFLKKGGLWVSAYDLQNKLYVAAHHLPGTANSDFWPGPMDTLLLKASNPEPWDRTWNLNKNEVNDHRKKWAQPGYSMPLSIAEWPANGKQHTAPVLAPFVDTDGDGRYLPENGDFPLIHGDELLYAIANDEYDEHLVSKAAPLKWELHAKAYVFDDFPELLILEYSLINRTPIAFKDIRLSWVGDLSLGNSSDNRFSSDSSEHALMGYNADDLDEGPDGFGTNLPWIWVKSLSLPASASVSLSGTGLGSYPRTDEEFRRVQEGFWANGSPLNTIEPNASSTRFLYNKAQWSDTTMPVSRFAVLTADLPTLPANTAHRWHLAVLTGTSLMPGLPNELHEVKIKLKPYYNQINSVYDAQHQVQPVFDVTPSIWNGRTRLKVHSSAVISEWQVLDIQGRVVWESSAIEKENNEYWIEWLPGDQLSEGWYVILGKSTSGSLRQKILKYSYH